MSAPFQLTSSDPSVIDPVGLAADTHEWIERWCQEECTKP
ncbi:beta-mannosidase [Cutibacterium acnes JCM 18909]|nr:beta-mannosidase [Cutibacterium acnes JCM 18909]GAE74408.1 beta-mannosidase [Cutibacterium acnes JCM 18918]